MASELEELADCTCSEGFDGGSIIPSAHCPIEQHRTKANEYYGKLEKEQAEIMDGTIVPSPAPDGWPGRPQTVMERAYAAAERIRSENIVAAELSPESQAQLDRVLGRTKTRAEIEAEKAAKPRPDLLPARALSMVVHDSTGEIFADLADYFKTKHVADLGPVFGAILDECVEQKLASSRAAVLIAAGEIMGVGFRKHGPCTWRVAGTEQADPQCHYASLVRHLLEHTAGLTTDPDSGKHPLLHAVCQIAIMINLLDDPPKVEGKNDGRAMIGAVK